MWKWKQGGGPSESTNRLHQDMKLAKRRLQKSQRHESAVRREKVAQDIMDANGYKLVSAQRRTSTNNNVLELKLDENVFNTPEDVLTCWRTHFTNLATPSEDPSFAELHKENATRNIVLISQICGKEGNNILPATHGEVRRAVQRLNNNKAADSNGLTSEHLKLAGHTIIPYLAMIINRIFKEK